MKHTKTPWETEETFIHPKGKKITIAEVYNRSNYMPANGYEIPNESEGKANAELIVHAVNMHEKLLQDLKDAVVLLKQYKLSDIDNRILNQFNETLSQAERK